MTKTTFSLLFFQTGYNVSRWIQSLYTVLNLRFQKTKEKYTHPAKQMLKH